MNRKRKVINLIEIRQLKRKLRLVQENISNINPGENCVAEFSTASYEVAKFSIIFILLQDEKINADFCIKSEGVDQAGAQVEFRYKLFQKKRDGVTGYYS